MRMSSVKSGIGGLVLSLSVVALGRLAEAATPVPTVVGPVPVTADSYPFGAADQTRVPENLTRVGYVVVEILNPSTSRLK